MTSFTAPEGVKHRILDGLTSPLIRDGHLIFTSIRLQQVHGEMCVEFINGSTTVCHMTCGAPNFAAGETLTLNGISGWLAIELEAT